MPKHISSSELDRLKDTIDIVAIQNNNAYYDGENPPILDEKGKRKPDNKIPVAFGYRLIANLSGFAARTGDIFINQVPKDKDVKDTNDTDFEKARKLIDEANFGLLLNSLLYIEVLKQGISYDVVWTTKEEGSEDMVIKYAQIPNHQAVPIWSEELETVRTLTSFIRYWDSTVIAGSEAAKALLIQETNNEEIKVNFAQVFEKGGYQIYMKVGEGKWLKKDEFVSQPFTTIQVSVYRGNKKARSYFQPVKVLMDQFDKLISRNMNAVERFNSSLLAVLKKISPDVKDTIDEMGLIDNLVEGMENRSGDLTPKFITQDIPVAHATLMMDTLKTLIYEIEGSPNFSSESFGTASGIALLFRLIGLEYSASEIDVWYDQGLQNRNVLINEALREQQNKPTLGDDFVPVIKHIRNLPVDKSFLAKIGLDLKALGISMETILKLFPKDLIPDADKELVRIKEEKAANALLFQNSIEQDGDEEVTTEE